MLGAFNNAVITPYGVMLAAGMILAGLWARRRAVRRGIDASHIDLMLPTALIGGILGILLFRWLSGPVLVPVGDGIEVTFRRQFFVFLFFTAPFIVLYTRYFGLPLRLMADVLAIPMLLGIICIRIGCFLAGCCWGDVIAAGLDRPAAAELQTASWLDPYLSLFAVQFPAHSYPWLQHRMAGLIGPEASRSLPVHPTQLYEGVLVALMLVGLLWAGKARRIPGGMALAALSGYAAIRFTVEFFRADNPYVAGILTSHQLAALALIGMSAFGYIYLRGKARHSAPRPDHQPAGGQ